MTEASLARPELDERHFRRILLLIAVAASLHAGLYLPFVSPHRTQDTPSYTAPAHAILHGRYTVHLGSRDITAQQIPPRARRALQADTYRTPGYPFFLALLGGGSPGVSQWLVLAAQVLLFVPTTYLVGLLARRLMSARLALATAALYALDPYSKRYASIVLTEVLAGLLFVALAYAYIRARQSPTHIWWAAAGTLAAALTLVRPIFGFIVALVALGALAGRAATRDRILRAALVLVAATLILAPWLVRNESVLGRPVLTTFGEGWGLLLGAHGEGPAHSASAIARTASFGRDFYGVRRFAPSSDVYLHDPNAHARYLYRADREQRREAIDLYAHRLRVDAATTVGDALYRAYYLWSARRDWYQPRAPWALIWLRLVDWGVLALALVGTWLAFKRRSLARELAACLAIFTLVMAPHHVEARYSIPLRTVYLLLATSGALAIVTRRSRQIQTVEVATLPTEKK